ncbi:preQ(1) synthase [Desulfatiferula olefinivorans]
MTTNKTYQVNYTALTPDTVKKDVLEAIDYAYASTRSIDITIRQPEFTSVCPMTGLPDYGCITVIYRPDQSIVELKSLKYYFLQYRNVGMFYEHVVNRILDDLADVLRPLSMEVIGEFTSRGGISSCARAVYVK